MLRAGYANANSTSPVSSSSNETGLTIVKLEKSNPDSRQLRASIHEERKWHQVA
jgi:hypothetical protein